MIKFVDMYVYTRAQFSAESAYCHVTWPEGGDSFCVHATHFVYNAMPLYLEHNLLYFPAIVSSAISEPITSCIISTVCVIGL